MRSIFKVLGLVVGALATFVVLAGVGVYFLFDGSPCGNELLAEAASPDGSLKAIVFQRDCGAATGFSTQVSVIKALATLENSSGNAFTADTNHGTAPSGPGGGPIVKVQWQTPRLLVVSHHAAARVFTAESKVGAINIRYEQLPQ
jgi:hypothetical protein